MSNKRLEPRRRCRIAGCALMLQLLAGCGYNSTCGRFYLVEDFYCCPDGTQVNDPTACPSPDAGTPDAGR